MTTTMTSWDLFEDLRAAQDELLQATLGRGWRPTGGSTTAMPAPRSGLRRSTYPNARTPIW